MTRRAQRSIAWACLLAVLIGLWPVAGTASSGVVRLVQDRVYRVGVYLVVDAHVRNQSASRMDGVEVSVEFYNFFDELLRAEHTVLRPVSLGPGHEGTFRVVTPFSQHVEGARSVRYRFTWREGVEQFQEVTKRDVWAIGQATRTP
jgi:hypothetical protein